MSISTVTGRVCRPSMVNVLVRASMLVCLL